jgi:hypothetical protein
MSMPMPSSITLIVRGTLVPKTLEAARAIHNETAGSPPGIAAARALGDLSHKVYAPCLADKVSGAKAGELLFIDTWVDAEGLTQFFSNPQVQAQAGKLFASRDATVWMPALGSLSYSLPAPMGKNERFVGMVRGPIASPEKAIVLFSGVDKQARPDARRRGLLSHQVFIKMNPPGDTSPVELCGIDVWCDFKGMTEHYDDATHMSVLSEAFTGRPTTAIWEQAPGQWSEW